MSSLLRRWSGGREVRRYGRRVSRVQCSRKKDRCLSLRFECRKCEQGDGLVKWGSKSVRSVEKSKSGIKSEVLKPPQRV